MLKAGQYKQTEQHRARIGAANRGKHHTEETKRKLSERWRRKGYARSHRSFGNPLYRDLRKLVFERDHYACVTCDKNTGRLELHHISSWEEYPALRFEPENCVVLCRRCHVRWEPLKGKKCLLGCTCKKHRRRLVKR